MRARVNPRQPDRGGAVVNECPNCATEAEEWDDHFGSQGWLCEPAPIVARVATLTKSLLTASITQGV